ncbi:MAG: hypothetical protein ACR2N4_19040 [Jatrophihabitans sp.]
MANIPTPIRAALGLAATALDEARKLPETLPQVPVVAISTAMQASLRVQQHIAALAARGDELIGQLRGTSAEAPSWATFDEALAEPADQPGGGSNGRQTAAFDRVDLAADDSPGRFDTAAVGGTEAATPDQPATTPEPTPAKPGAAAKNTASAKAAASAKAVAPPKTAKAASPAKAAKVAPAKPAKATKRSEPLAVAAKKAKPSKTPNPATMAAEIVAAQAADSPAGADGADQGGAKPGPGGE